MLLTIDAGNTNVVFAVFDTDSRSLIGEWRVSTKGDRTADEYFVWLDTLLKRSDIDAGTITGAIISTVVPQTLFNLRTLCERYFGCTPMVVGENDLDLGLDVMARDAGADRLVNAVAAHQTYDGPLVLIDFGTATTFDVVGEDGTYRGGIISPGINLSLEALHMAAAKLPHIAVAKPTQSVVGTDTVSAMQSGVYWGYIGLIEGLVKRIENELEAPVTVIATGGLAPLFANATEVIDHVDQELTIRGLVDIYFRNKAA